MSTTRLSQSKIAPRKFVDDGWATRVGRTNPSLDDKSCSAHRDGGRGRTDSDGHTVTTSQQLPRRVSHHYYGGGRGNEVPVLNLGLTLLEVDPPTDSSVPHVGRDLTPLG